MVGWYCKTSCFGKVTVKVVPFIITMCRNVATMHLYKSTYQRKADTGTCLMSVHLIKTLEDSFHIGRRNVTAGIEDGQTVVLFRL